MTIGAENEACGACGSLRLEKTKSERFVAIDGETWAGMIPCMRCKTCGAEHVARDLVARFEETAALVARGAIDVEPFRVRRAPQLLGVSTSRRGPARGSRRAAR